MCSLCKMDPKDVARYLQRQGAVEIDDFYKEVNYRPRKKKPVRKRSPRSAENRGCLENDHGPHVYVWTQEYMREDLFFRFYGYHKYEREHCAGCGKKRNTREFDRYERIKLKTYRKFYGDEYHAVRGKGPVPRIGRRWAFGAGSPSYSYFNWENYDEDYVNYRREYRAKYGWNRIVDASNRYDWF